MVSAILSQLHGGGGGWGWMFVLVLAILCGDSPAAWAARPSNWRVFRSSDGLGESYASAVTVSPRGIVWVKHGGVDEISFLDGYSIRTLPSPGRDTYRVYASRAGQLWSLYEEDSVVQGLAVYDGRRWTRHPIAQIREETQVDPRRRIRQIPLVPAELDHVLFLLSDRLMKYDVSRRQATLLREVGETGLGKFLEMAEAREGNGIWITGAKGLARLSGQLRDLDAASPLEQHLVDPGLRVENLQRPFENDRGEVFAVATDSLSGNDKIIVQFDGRNWSKRAVPAGENLKQAWPGWDETIWAFGMNSLLRLDPGPPLAVSKESAGMGQYKDVATETNGVFWLASSEGLARYAPFAWRMPGEAEEVDGPVRAILEDREGRLWFAGTEALILNQGNQWKKIRWPDDLEPDLRVIDSLYALPSGSIAIGAGDRPLVFDPATEKFRPLAPPSRARLKIIGQFRNGKLCVQVQADPAANPGVFHLELFDGETFAPFLQAQRTAELNAELSFLLEARNGDLWLGGAAGVGLYRDGVFRSFGPAHGFGEERPLCLLELDEGRLWCGGGDRILEFNGKSWATVRTGLDRVNQMVRTRDGRIWIATGRGVIAYRNGSWVANGIEEGLPNSSVLAVSEDRRGRIWAATTRGFSLYHPDADLYPPKTFPPTVENPGSPSAEGPITVVFNAVDRWQYTPADRLLFSWRIDDGVWSPYTNAMTEFVANLAPGKHRFEVRSMDRNWNADPDSAMVELSIVIPWYKESRLIVILVSGGALVLFFAGLAVNRHVQLIRSYAEVEKIVAVRTRELERANKELLHSQKMRALGTLAAGIAHDFNNILSIIKGSAQIIEGHLDDKEKIRARVSRIKTVVDQGAGIVKSMLGLSRVTERDLLPCDLNTVVEDTLRLLGDPFLQDVTIQFEGAPSLPAFPAVKELIQQMLLNLILNATDAMSGAGEVLVRTGQTNTLPENLALPPTASAQFLYVAVQDSGCGITPEVLPRIFEPFFTTKALSTRRGTGLGLSMVYEFSKELGYGLKVKSSAGKGSTFTIFIPFKIHCQSDRLD